MPTEKQRLAGTLRKAQTLLSMGRPLEAIKIYERIRKQHPDNVKLNNQLATLYLDQLRVTEAVNLLGNALNVDPTYYMTHVNLANVYYNLGLVEAAKERAEVAIKMSPEEPEGYYAFGLIIASMSHTDEALKAFDFALSLKPNEPRYLQSKCELITFLYIWDQAAEACEASVDIEPRNVISLNNLGQAYLNLNRWEESRSMLQAAAAIEPDNTRVQDNLKDLQNRLSQQQGTSTPEG